MLPPTRAELEKIREDCRSLVTIRAGIAAAASAVPVPGIDIGSDVAIMMEMMPTINRRFGLAPDQIGDLPPALQGMILGIIGKGGSTFVGKLITKQLILTALRRIGVKATVKQVTKYVPFVGTAISASIGFAAMKMLGDRHVEDCYQIAVQALDAGKLESPAGNQDAHSFLS